MIDYLCMKTDSCEVGVYAEGYCVTATGDRSQLMVDIHVQALSRMGDIRGRNLGDP